MRKPDAMPAAVLAGLERWRAQHPGRFLGELQWDALNGCYKFYCDGMYIGVELDGYVHS